jgi:hypothetical protein
MKRQGSKNASLLQCASKQSDTQIKGGANYCEKEGLFNLDIFHAEIKNNPIYLILLSFLYLWAIKFLDY